MNTIFKRPRVVDNLWAFLGLLHHSWIEVSPILLFQFRYRRDYRHTRNRSRIDLKPFVVFCGICNVLSFRRSPCKTTSVAFIYFPEIVYWRLHQQIGGIGIAPWTNHVISPFSSLFSGVQARTVSFQEPPGAPFLFLNQGQPV